MANRRARSTQHSQRDKPGNELQRISLVVLTEFIGSAFTILSVYGIRKLVELLLGGQLLWDFLPIRYCADTVDAAVFLGLIWRTARRIND